MRAPYVTSFGSTLRASMSSIKLNDSSHKPAWEMTLIAEVNEITSGLSLLVAIPFKSFREIVQELLCWHALMQELNVTMPGTSDAWDACSMMEMAHCHSLAFSHTLIALLKVIRLGVTSHLLASCRIWIPNCHRESIALIRVFKLTTSGKSFRVEVAEFSGFSKSWKSCTATCHCPAVALAAIAALMHTMSAWSETSLIWKSKASASSQRPSPSNDLMAALYAISFDATPSASSMDDNTLKAAFHSCARLQDLIAAPYVTSLIGICRAFIRSMRCRACVHPPAVEPVLPMTALKWKVCHLHVSRRKKIQDPYSFLARLEMFERINPPCYLVQYQCSMILNVFILLNSNQANVIMISASLCWPFLTSSGRLKILKYQISNHIKSQIYDGIGSWSSAETPLFWYANRILKTCPSWSWSRATFFKNLVANCGLLENRSEFNQKRNY